ncbi:MAG: ferrous iron transport protein A [Sporomusaceae bacterium]|nr:ferrous iron transport protein A [Sporomusaceae bacterium]
MAQALSELTAGQKARVVRIVGKGPIKRRIFDIGIVPGALIEVQKFAPLGDPMEIKVKAFNLSLRKQEAEYIEVEIVTDEVCCLA